MTPTCACGQPVSDATLCGACADRLAADLAAVPELRRQLDLTLSRQTASGRQDGGRSAEKPLPYDLGASDAHHMLGLALRPAVRAIGHRESPSVDRCAAILAACLPDVAQLMDADGHARRIGDAVAKARRSVDRQEDRIFAGSCDGHGHTARPEGAPDQGCGQWLYARMKADAVRCHTCSTTYDVVMRRGWMLEAAEDYLANATILSRFVSRLGAPVKANTIQQWKRRGRLEQRGTDDDGHPTYRIGDVLDLVHGDAQRHAVSRSSNGA